MPKIKLRAPRKKKPEKPPRKALRHPKSRIPEKAKLIRRALEVGERFECPHCHRDHIIIPAENPKVTDMRFYWCDRLCLASLYIPAEGNHVDFIWGS